MKVSKFQSAKNEGKLNTPWDKAWKQTLIRNSPSSNRAPYILDLGINYFVLKLEKMGLKTFWSCEGHPSGFYLVFQEPHRIARKISIVSVGYSINVSIANINRWTGTKEGGRIPNCWNLHFLPHGNSYECRNYLLRGLSIQWEKEL